MLYMITSFMMGMLIVMNMMGAGIMTIISLYYFVQNTTVYLCSSNGFDTDKYDCDCGREDDDDDGRGEGNRIG